VDRREASSFVARLQAELSDLEMRAQLRTLEFNTGVNLCSNDYLGLATDARLKAELLDGVNQTWQMGATGSRLLSGNSREWEQLEEEFAEFAGTSDALYFSSGYAANIGLLSSLLGPVDWVFSDSLNHASISMAYAYLEHGKLSILIETLTRLKMPLRFARTSLVAS